MTIEVTEDELIASLTRQAAAQQLANAAIVSLIGAVDEFTISVMPADNPEINLPNAFTKPAELSGTGEITNGEVHIHAIMAAEGVASSRVYAGHLHAAQVRAHFVRAYILPAGEPCRQ